MTELQQKQLDFLTDTINHFNLNNRGVNSANDWCSYEKGCAIGRCLPIELAKKFDTQGGVIMIFDELPSKLKELEIRFLKAIQMLHDDENYWNETGLSEKGKERVEQIKTQFNLKLLETT